MRGKKQNAGRGHRGGRAQHGGPFQPQDNSTLTPVTLPVGIGAVPRPESSNISDYCKGGFNGKCGKAVGDSDDGLQGDSYNNWFHIACQHISP